MITRPSFVTGSVNPARGLGGREGSEVWELAACYGKDTALFFADEELRGTNRNTDVEKAQEICAACPIIGHCREYSLRTRQEFGIWGGLTAAERRKELRRRDGKARMQAVRDSVPDGVAAVPSV